MMWVFYWSLFVLILQDIANAQTTPEPLQVSLEQERQGRLILRVHNVPGTVCPEGVNQQAAAIICRMLGYGGGGVLLPPVPRGPYRTVWLSRLQCSGNERDIRDCDTSVWANTTCRQPGDAAILCPITNTPRPGPTPTRVFLVDGPDFLHGRVILQINNENGTICDNSFDNNAARVICWMLGYSGFDSIFAFNTFGPGTGRILLNNVRCRGTEREITNCSHDGLGVHNCGHHQDVSVLCGPRVSPADRVRVFLLGGPDRLHGRLHVEYNNENGTVCDDRFGFEEALVVCRMLGYRGTNVNATGMYGRGSGRILLDELYCIGNEISIGECFHRPWGQNDCSHEEDIGINCGPIIVQTCPPLGEIPNGRITSTDNQIGAVVHYICNSGYAPNGRSPITCVQNAPDQRPQWSPPPLRCIRPVCPLIESIENGRISSTNNELGSVVRYFCNTGYVLSGSSPIVCLQNGPGQQPRWTPTPPQCTLQACPPLEPVQNGRITATGNVLGSVARYMCDPGYVLNGTSPIACLQITPGQRPEWTPRPPLCNRPTCDPLEIEQNGRMSSTNNQIGSVVHYTCNSGFVLSGSSPITCVENVNGLLAQWTPRPPRCRRPYCPPIESLENGGISPTSNVIGSVVRFICNSGFVLNGSRHSTCRQNGQSQRPQWTPRPPRCSLSICPPPQPIENGRSSPTNNRIGSVIRYTCNDGFGLNGTNIIICLQNIPDRQPEWIPEPPRCDRFTCPPIQMIENGRVSSSNNQIGSVVHFTCDSGYGLNGTSPITCRQNASDQRPQWTPEQPRCSRLRCPALGPLENGRISPDNSVIGSVVFFFCNTGFVLSGTSPITCLQNDPNQPPRWTPPPPRCDLPSCPALRAIRNGRIGSTNNQLGSVVFYTCNPGFVLSGTSPITCLRSAVNQPPRWVPPPPQCISPICPALQPLQNGRISPTNNQIGSVVFFICNAGFVLTGTSPITCLQNVPNQPPQWVPAPPQCIRTAG